MAAQEQAATVSEMLGLLFIHRTLRTGIAVLLTVEQIRFIAPKARCQSRLDRGATCVDEELYAASKEC